MPNPRINALNRGGTLSGDLDKLEGITDGTAAANKALVLDSSKGIATITSATITTLTSTDVNTGKVTSTSPNVYDTNTTISAGAGGGTGNAVAITGEFNNVTTVASAFDSVILLTAVAGQIQTVKNSGASILSVFPNTDDSINALAADLSIDIPIGGEITFRAISAVVWETIESFYSTGPSTQKGGFQFKGADNSGNTDVIVTNASHGQATTVSIPDSGLSTAHVLQSTAAITAVEADVLDGATQGAGVASKVVVLDSSGDFEFQDDDVLGFGADADLQIAYNTTDSITTSGPSTLLWAGAPSLLDPDPYKFYGLFDDFMNPATSATSDVQAWVKTTGSGGTQVYQDAAGGIFNVVTAGADNDHVSHSSFYRIFQVCGWKEIVV